MLVTVLNITRLATTTATTTATRLIELLNLKLLQLQCPPQPQLRLKEYLQYVQDNHQRLMIFDLEIGMSMAKLLKNQQDFPSSFESLNASVSSPVFTTLELILKMKICFCQLIQVRVTPPRVMSLLINNYRILKICRQ